MAGRMAGGSFEPDLIGYPMLIVNQCSHPLRHYGSHGIVDRVLEKRIFGAREKIPFGAADEVLCFREGCRPLVALEHGVPADVIDMQMSTNHVVDRLAWIADLLQVPQERQLQLV